MIRPPDCSRHTYRRSLPAQSASDTSRSNSTLPPVLSTSICNCAAASTPKHIAGSLNSGASTPISRTLTEEPSMSTSSVSPSTTRTTLASTSSEGGVDFTIESGVCFDATPVARGVKALAEVGDAVEPGAVNSADNSFEAMLTVGVACKEGAEGALIATTPASTSTTTSKLKGRTYQRNLKRLLKPGLNRDIGASP